MQPSPTSSHFISLWSKHSPQHPALSPCSSLNIKDNILQPHTRVFRQDTRRYKVSICYCCSQIFKLWQTFKGSVCSLLLLRATRHHILDNAFLHSPYHENVKSYMKQLERSMETCKFYLEIFGMSSTLFCKHQLDIQLLILYGSNVTYKQTPWPLVRERTIPTERPPLVDEI
jgi:hypothetical protein